jgi:hypothetical protein
MLFARRSLVVAVLALVAGLASVGLAEAGDRSPRCPPPPCSEPPPCELPPGPPSGWPEHHVQVFLRNGTLVIVGTHRHDVVTVKRFNGPTLGATPTYEVYVNGSLRPKLTFPVLDLRTGRRVTSIFMDGKDGFDKLFVEDGSRWQVRTKNVEQRGTLRPAG